MANLITTFRLLLLLPVLVLAYAEPSAWQLLNVPIIIVVFVSDALDGYVARKRNESNHFGALFDIAGDRIVEMTLWIVAADLDLIPIWVPLIVIVRGIVVDTIRSSESATKGVAPFALAHRPIVQWLIAGRFMRALYAVVKAHAFSLLLLILPLPAVFPAFWESYGFWLSTLTATLVYLSVLLCLVRGVPVVVEFVEAQRREASLS